MKAAQLLPIDVVMKLAGWSQESAITDQISNAILDIADK